VAITHAIRRRAHDAKSTGTFTGTPPEFPVLLCPLVYRGVTMCPASVGDAVKMWCYDRLRGLSGRFDSPRLQCNSFFRNDLRFFSSFLFIGYAILPTRKSLLGRHLRSQGWGIRAPVPRDQSSPPKTDARQPRFPGEDVLGGI